MSITYQALAFVILPVEKSNGIASISSHKISFMYSSSAVLASGNSFIDNTNNILPKFCFRIGIENVVLAHISINGLSLDACSLPNSSASFCGFSSWFHLSNDLRIESFLIGLGNSTFDIPIRVIAA
ncbi:hypothetical protein DRN75_04390 [Nanoarchaeota archaeon]|nr:MAG: hypothetical protein DRN75_04390 [Nanoarchaeota archaeon]